MEWQVGKQARRAGVKARSFLRMRTGGERKQRLLPDQPPGPYFLLPPSRREDGAQESECSNSSCPTSQVRSYSIREREREFKGTCPFDTAWRLTKAICARQAFSICLLRP